MSVISSTQDTNTSIVLWQKSDTQGDTNNAGYRRPKSEIKNVDIDLPHKASRRHPVSTVQMINTANRVKGGHMTLSMVHDAHPSLDMQVWTVRASYGTGCTTPYICAPEICCTAGNARL